MPPSDIGVIMVASKDPSQKVRDLSKEGSGVLALVLILPRLY